MKPPTPKPALMANLESTGRFPALAALCDQLRAIPARNKKIAAIADYLMSLSAADVPLAVRYLGGRAFRAGDGRSLGVGGAAVARCVGRIVGEDAPALGAAFRRHGEIGEAVRDLWATMPAADSPLTLTDIDANFELIRVAAGQDAKQAGLFSMLKRATPSEAVNLIKIILADMRSGVSEGVIELAIPVAFNVSLEAVRRARLLVGDVEQVAALAAAGTLDRARFVPFHPISFMLAQPVADAAALCGLTAERAAWAEDKYDGVRAQAHVVASADGGARVELFSRGSGAVTATFPDIAGPLAAFASKTGEAFVLDGEIVSMRRAADGAYKTLPFSFLQKRMGRKSAGEKLLRDYPCVFVAFDLLWINDTLLFDVPLVGRRGKLLALGEKIIAPSVAGGPGGAGATRAPFIVASAMPVADRSGLETLFAQARARRNEGLVVKLSDSLYTPGRRGDAWLKLKTHLPTLDCVVIAAERGHGKRRHVLSDFTFAVRAEAQGAEETLVPIGKAYSGLTDQEIAELTKRFELETIIVEGRLHRVRPAVILEIAFDQITKSSRHGGGYALRFPRIVRLRPDKSVRDVDTLARVTEIFEGETNLSRSIVASTSCDPTSRQMALFE